MELNVCVTLSCHKSLKIKAEDRSEIMGKVLKKIVETNNFLVDENWYIDEIEVTDDE